MPVRAMLLDILLTSFCRTANTIVLFFFNIAADWPEEGQKRTTLDVCFFGSAKTMNCKKMTVY